MTALRRARRFRWHSPEVSRQLSADASTELGRRRFLRVAASRVGPETARRETQGPLGSPHAAREVITGPCSLWASQRSIASKEVAVVAAESHRRDEAVTREAVDVALGDLPALGELAGGAGDRLRSPRCLSRPNGSCAVRVGQGVRRRPARERDTGPRRCSLTTGVSACRCLDAAGRPGVAAGGSLRVVRDRRRRARWIWRRSMRPIARTGAAGRPMSRR